GITMRRVSGYRPPPVMEFPNLNSTFSVQFPERANGFQHM
ncbi:MAG: hypothetical protein ACI82Z_001521, partial [Cellvibrionaceae bacterium]